MMNDSFDDIYVYKYLCNDYDFYLWIFDVIIDMIILLIFVMNYVCLMIHDNGWFICVNIDMFMIYYDYIKNY